jgi:hypothetical protein
MSVIQQSDSNFTVELTGKDLELYLKRRFPKKPKKRVKKYESIGTRKTTVKIKPHEYFTETVVTYHYTEVVSFSDFNIELNTGGWDTVTTKLRMNQTSIQFNLGYHIFQKNFEWYVKIWDKVYSYNQNELVINRVSKTVYDGKGNEVTPLPLKQKTINKI